jgi:hypothetical protein
MPDYGGRKSHTFFVALCHMPDSARISYLQSHNFLMEMDMQPGEIGFLVFAVGAISLFGGVLAWASWMEWRDSKRKARHQETRASRATKANLGDVVQRPF